MEMDFELSEVTQHFNNGMITADEYLRKVAALVAKAAGDPQCAEHALFMSSIIDRGVLG